MEFTENELAIIKWALEEIIPWLETEQDLKDLDSAWEKLGFDAKEE